MGNVASWSGTKTLTCFEFYDQAFADCFRQGKGQFSSIISVNWATMKNTANGPTMDGPTTRGPFKDIQNEGYLGKHSGLNVFKTINPISLRKSLFCHTRPSELSIFEEK